ncbi:MAG: hypothetical protein ACR2QH_18720 [Geminicoccaceae bacterium]
MERAKDKDAGLVGWSWFDVETEAAAEAENDDLARAFARCFNGSDGALVLQHLRQSVLDRRLGPGASDAELRFLEGQRSIAAHILSMIDRGRS